MAKIQYMKKGGGLDTDWGGSKKRQDTDIRAEKTLKDDGIYATVDAAEITMYGPRWENHFTDTYVDAEGRWSATRRMAETPIGKEHHPEVGEQGTLFSRAPGKIAVAFAAPSMRSTVPTLLGLAANEHTKQWMDKDPQLPMPSSDLSPYSSALVKKLEGRGVPFPKNPSNPTAEITNEYGFDHSDHLIGTESRVGPFKPFSKKETQAGLATTKAVLRGQQFHGGS